MPIHMKPGQTITVDDRYRRLKNIDGAIRAGLIEVVSYDSSDTSTVVQAEVNGGSGNGTLGDSGDCNYEDGLLVMDEDTLVGEAVCEINKVLASLAPIAAPDLDNILPLSTGSDGALSFGSSNIITEYFNVTGISDLPERNVDGTFASGTFGEDERIGIIFSGGSFSAELNGNVSADGINYPDASFGNGTDGTVSIVLNGVTLLTADLTSTIAPIMITSANGSSLSLSAASYGSSATGEPFELYAHRTGTFTISENDMYNGWNYVQCVHKIDPSTPSSFIYSNYNDWVRDIDTTSITADSANMDNLNMSGLKQNTGISYYTSGEADYNANINNGYRNVYDDSIDSITFNGNNISTPPMLFDPILTDDESKIRIIDGQTGTITATKLINDSISVSVNATHPRIEDSLSSGGLASISNILMDNTSASSTNTIDLFVDENYRLEPGNYSSQSDVSNVINVFDSSTDRSSGGHAIVYDGKLVGVPSLTNGGDFTSIANAPTPNVDYSTIPAGDLTYYRKVTNNSGGSLTGFTLSMNGSGQISTVLPVGNTEIFIEAKNPGKTGWMTFLPFNFTYNDGDGMLSGSLQTNLNAVNEGTFGTEFFENGDSIVFRFTVLRGFIGNIDSIVVNLT
jgi:hypothetical protein